MKEVFHLWNGEEITDMELLCMPRSPYARYAKYKWNVESDTPLPYFVDNGVLLEIYEVLNEICYFE